MNKFNKLFNIIMEELTPQQKQKVDNYTAKRSKTLSFRKYVRRRTYIFSTKRNIVSSIKNA
jgi:hypothetical protein